jgi:hypothetical protein
VRSWSGIIAGLILLALVVNSEKALSAIVIALGFAAGMLALTLLQVWFAQKKRPRGTDRP